MSLFIPGEVESKEAVHHFKEIKGIFRSGTQN